MSRNVISQGYVRQGRIAPVEGLHDGVEFRYTPMLPQEVERANDRLKSLNVDDSLKFVNQVLAERIKQWSEVDENGREVAITAENIGSIGCYALWLRLQQIVWGIAANEETAADLKN